MRHRGIVVLLCAAVGAARAAPPAEQAGAVELQARLDALAREEAELARRAEEDAARDRALLEERRVRRHALAEEVLTLGIARERLEARLRGVEEEAASARTRADALAAAVEGIRSAGVSLAEQVEILLDGVPASGERAAAAARLRRALAPEGEAPAALADLPALVEDTLRLVSTVSARETTLRLADGRAAPAELLCAGNLAFAYRCEGRRAVALASPADALGFRWTEAIGRATGDAVDAAFRGVAAGDEVCDIPMDASGMLRVDGALGGWTLRRIWEAGGLVMWPLGAVALLAAVLVFERVLYLARQGGRAEKLLDRVLDACTRGDVPGARAECTRSRGLVARGLAACLAHHAGGAKAMEDGFQEQLLHELPRLERSLSGLGMLAAVAPLLGLLGTVTGIIQTFGVIRVFGNANPGLMAGGIAEALVTTATGLVIAIPTLLLHSVLRGRVDLLTGHAEQSAATLLNRLAPHGGA